MSMGRVFVGVLAAAVLLAALPVSAKSKHAHVRMERDVGEPNDYVWQRLHEAKPQDKLNLVVAVKQRNVQALEETLLAVSDPRSSRYGRHLSLAEVNALVAPSAASINAVVEWFAEHNITGKAVHHSPNSDFISAVVTVAKAEEMLHCKYHLYRHFLGKAEATRASEYHVPHHLAQHIDFVSPTVRFPQIRQVRAADPDALFVTPSFLHQLYQADGVVSQDASNTQAVASFLGQYFSPTDLQTFFKTFWNTSLGDTPNTIGAEGPLPGVEAELDVQYIMSVGAGVNTTVYYTPGRNPNNPENEPFLAWIQNVSAEANPPYVISVSYGEDEQSVGYDYATRINQEFMEIGSRGISLMFASGDDGVGGNCSGTHFSPDYPSGSPYVTAVGGLTGGTAGKTPTGEQADYISGGGFSNLWPQPSWQTDAVEAYLSNKTGLPKAANYNATGRGYPDVAAQSEGFLVVTYGIPQPVAGTSCASPTFTGIVSLLNDVRLQNGKSPLGFLNPWIYQTAPANPNAFNDAVEGYNMGCTGSDTGFPARAGWDAATGWGSPNYSILSKLVADLP